MSNNSTAPCYNCDNRHMNCHGECEAYKSYKACVDATRAQRYKVIKEEGYFDLKKKKKREYAVRHRMMTRKGGRGW